LAGILLFMLATTTDLIDGIIARKYNVITEFGKFMDPLADKLLVISSLVALVYMEYTIELWMVLVIIGRDILITIMRILAKKKGTPIKTSQLGKLKTSFQLMSIWLILIIIAVKTYPESASLRADFQSAQNLGLPNWKIALHSFTGSISSHWLVGMPYILMLLTTIFTFISGVRYIITNYRLFIPNQSQKQPPANLK
jgi:cardiolipin synthase